MLVKKSFIESLSIIIAYIPLSVAFGLNAKVLDFSFLETFLASASIFGGASQFVFISLAKDSLFIAVVAASLLNIRHLVYSKILKEKFHLKQERKTYILSFFLTDEVFSIITSKPNFNFLNSFLVGFFSYISWVVGTIIGYQFSGYINIKYASYFEISLLLLFFILSILLFQKKYIFYSIVTAFIAVLSFLFNMIVPGLISLMFFILIRSKK